MRAYSRRQSFTVFDLTGNVCTGQHKFFATAHIQVSMSVNDSKSATYIDFGITNTF